jgi:type IV secretion system protein VirB10
MTDKNKSVDEMVNEISAQENAVIRNSEHHDLGGSQKKRKSSLNSKLGFALVGVVVFLVAGVKLYKTFYAEDKTQEVAIPNETVNTTVKPRNDLGKDFNPFETDKPIQTEETDNSNSNVTVAEPDKAVSTGFKKFMSIPVTKGNSNQSTTKNSSNNTASTAESGDAAKSTEPKSPDVKAMSATAIKLDPNLYIQANTYIPCVLPFRFVSDVAGKVSCIITEDVYSANGNVKLIEKGTKANGQYKTGTLAHGQGRMFVIWDQLRTPDFKKITLVDTAAYGELGEAGIDGWVDTHFWERFGGSLMLSMVQDVAAAAANNVSSKDRNVDYTENSRDALSEMAKVALENSINIPPTMYKNQGDIIGIIVGDDIDFSSVYQIKAR